MEITNNLKKYFTKRLVAWHGAENNRSLPWKGEQNPYRIWLSEVILQQTRALQGLPYYQRFIAAYPTVEDMAAANDGDAFRLWQGLGYYNRCKNMLATARYIAKELNGIFPDSYNGLLNLKGVGPYTAAAIVSFAFGKPHAVVDGNVYRVLARFFGVDTPFDTGDGKKVFAALAGALLDPNDSASYNQAIMDLGASVCTPRKPLCGVCPLQKKCFALEKALIDVLPVRSKKQSVSRRYFNYLVLKWKDTIWIHKRTDSDIWENLHEFYLVESRQPIDKEELILNDFFKNKKISYDSIEYEGQSTQRLTHQLIEAHFFGLQLSEKPEINNIKGKWMSKNELKKTAFPKTVVSFLEKNLYF